MMDESKDKTAEEAGAALRRRAFGWSLALWVLLCLVSGRAEAWDSPLYFIAGLPLLAAGAALCGWRAAGPAWRWALLVTGGQAAGMFLTGLLAGHDLSLLPLGLIFLAVACVLPQWLAAWLGRKARALAARREKG